MQPVLSVPASLVSSRMRPRRCAWPLKKYIIVKPRCRSSRSSWRKPRPTWLPTLRPIRRRRMRRLPPIWPSS
eukprot:7698-Pyramimonas_sp.AAC.1